MKAAVPLDDSHVRRFPQSLSLCLLVLTAALALLVATPLGGRAECEDYSEYLRWLRDWNIGTVDAIAISEGHAFVAIQSYGLKIIDLSHPEAPVLAGDVYWNYDMFGAMPVAVEVIGHHAFVLDRFWGIVVIDVSDPADPYRYEFDFVASGNDMAWNGEYLLVLNESDRLLVVSIADPSEPTIVAEVGLPGLSYDSDLAALGDLACVANGNLMVVDLTNPLDPILTATAQIEGSITHVTGRDQLAYVSNSLQDSERLIVYDLSDPSAPDSIGIELLPQRAEEMVSVGDLVYVTGYGLYVVDVTDPTVPALRGQLPVPEPGTGLSVGESVACFGSFHIADVSQPFGLMPFGEIDLEGPAYEVAVFEQTACVTAHGSGLNIVDIDDPNAPALLDNVALPGLAHDVAILPPCAFVAAREAGIHVVDFLTDPEDANRIASYDTPGTAWGVALAGNYLLVADESHPQRCIAAGIPRGSSS